jgi:adenosylcobalamin-dependent ribonucleoside-diphosphate reductase
MSTKETEKTRVSDEITTPILSVDESATTEQRLTDNAVNNILPARYLLDGETPDEMFMRVADNVATAEYIYDDGESADESFETWRDEFYNIMSTLRFMPNSPTLMNAGDDLQQLSACFVLEVGDSMDEPDENGRESILTSNSHAGQIFKSGGGVGYTFGFLRPKGTRIESTNSKTSGPMQFMEYFDSVCETVKQGGKRRGAQMGIMPITHPDVGRFIVSKREEGRLSNFNISVGLTDEFIEAVNSDGIYQLKDPRENFDETFEIVEETKNFFAPSQEDSPEAVVDENIWRDYAGDIDAWDWENEETVSFRDKWYAHFQSAEAEGNLDVGEEMALPARFIWDMMIDGAWRNGEPGLFYLDETNREHTFDVDEHPEYEIHATNPCAEQPLNNYEACNLGHLNLSLFVKEGATPYPVWREKQDFDYYNESSAVVDYLNESIDYDDLDRVIESGTRFLDNVIDMSDFPLEEIEETVGDMRKIGLGVMGWAQMCYQLGIQYGSDESYTAAKHVMSYIDAKATRASHELAKHRGNFPAWDDSKYANPTEYTEWFESHAHVDPSDYEDGYAMRNHNVTTVAPTGTTSMIADTSGGIEPVYNVAYKKNVGEDIQGDDKLVEFDSYFVQALEENDISVEETKEEAAELMDKNEFDGVEDLSTVPDELAEIFVTTNDLSSKQHGLMQRAFQHAVDSGISKTVNLPNEATRADVHEAYMLALKEDEIGSPIKGLTVYRDGSREKQVLSTGEATEKELEEAKETLEQAGYEIEEPDNGGDE